MTCWWYFITEHYCRIFL